MAKEQKIRKIGTAHRHFIRPVARWIMFNILLLMAVLLLGWLFGDGHWTVGGLTCSTFLVAIGNWFPLRLYAGLKKKSYLWLADASWSWDSAGLFFMLIVLLSWIVARGSLYTAAVPIFVCSVVGLSLCLVVTVRLVNSDIKAVKESESGFPAVEDGLGHQ